MAAACSPVRSFGSAVLAKRLETDLTSARRRARRLVRAGALFEPEEDRFLRAPELAPVGRLYALEAKVDDWSGGLGQALRYGSWADASAVVMGQLPRDPSAAIRQASGLGVGLALGSRWLVRPKVRRHALAHRLWASEFVVAALSDARQISASGYLP